MKTEISSYEQQAIDFLNDAETTFSAKFLKFDYYFEGDKQKRNIFKITLKNTNNSYSFNFGSSIADSCKNAKDIIYDTEIDFFYGLKYEGLKRQYLTYSDKIQISHIKEIGTFTKLLIDKRKAKKLYDEFLASNLNKYIKSLNIISLNEWIEKLEIAIHNKVYNLRAKNYGEGLQNENIIYPSAYDVLTCLQKYDVGSFEDFCCDFGYDQDSRKAEKIYKAVCDEFKNVQLLFTFQQLEQLQEIQ